MMNRLRVMGRDGRSDHFTHLCCSEVHEVGFLLPMGLHQHAIDVVDVDGPGATADGFDHAADAEVASFAQDAIGGTHDEIDGGLGEGVVPESDTVELPWAVLLDLLPHRRREKMPQARQKTRREIPILRRLPCRSHKPFLSKELLSYFSL